MQHIAKTLYALSEVWVFVCFRWTDDVPQERCAWQHPESVCHRPSTPAVSPVDHMEELWMRRWACESPYHLFPLPNHVSRVRFTVALWKLLKLHLIKKWIRILAGIQPDMLPFCLLPYLHPSCQCERYVSAEELCNTSCLSRLPQLSAQLSPDGHLLLSIKESHSMVWAKVMEG